jgi:hypothetical protein
MLNPNTKALLEELTANTAGAIDLQTCRQAGMTYRQVNRLLTNGRWQSLFPRVYVAFDGPIPAVTMHHATLLYAGTDAALSYESAGFLWYLCRQPRWIHITIPYGRHVVAQPGLVIHRSRSLSVADVHPALAPRRTRIERTVIDLLAHAGSAGAALSIVADAMRNRRTTPDRLRLALGETPRVRWRTEVLAALPDVAAGAHSLLEIQDARIRRNHHLPDGERQFAEATTESSTSTSCSRDSAPTSSSTEGSGMTGRLKSGGTIAETTEVPCSTFAACVRLGRLVRSGVRGCGRTSRDLPPRGLDRCIPTLPPLPSPAITTALCRLGNRRR